MKDPDFKPRLVRLIFAGCTALAATVLAESPENGSNKHSGSRSRPQVIYHLPRASNYAATLHSQAKGQSTDVPVDSELPRANANAAPIEQQQTVTAPSSERRVKVRSNRAPVRQRSFMKSPGHGNGHGKSHKK
jgi:hypothetical protein